MNLVMDNFFNTNVILENCIVRFQSSIADKVFVVVDMNLVINTWNDFNVVFEEKRSKVDTVLSIEINEIVYNLDRTICIVTKTKLKSI